MTDTETNPYEESERSDAIKLQQAHMIGRYKPEEGRADRLAANLPGARSMGSTKGTLR